MIKPRCPDPERLALLIENRIGRTARARILRHAADCVSCRRQLAIASLSPMSPFRAAIELHLASGWLTVAAGVLLGVLVLGFLNSSSGPEDAAPRTARRPPPKVRPEPRIVSEAPSLPTAAEQPPAPLPREVPPVSVDASPRRIPRDRDEHATPVPAAPIPAPAPAPVAIPHRLESVAEGAPAPTPAPAADPRAVEMDALGRLAILDPFGSLALEGSGGRQPVQGSRVIPVEARLTAVGRTSGFRLGDGIRIQLAAGSAISVFQNTTRSCAGLSLLQGALLVESAQPRSIYLRREGTSGVLEGMNGPVSVTAGAKPDSFSVVPLGAGVVVWKRAGAAPVEISTGDLLGIDAAGQELAGRSGKPKPSLTRFVSWPEPSSLFYSSFEEGVQGMEKPTVVQGASKEGYVAAAAVGGKGRKTIELTLPASLGNLPSDATLRLRVRTTAARIQCGVGRDSSHSVPITVTQRNRSETVWTTLSVAFSALDQDGHRGRNDGRNDGRNGGRRTNLTFVAEASSRLSAEEMVFDIDEIEISRS